MDDDPHPNTELGSQSATINHGSAPYAPIWRNHCNPHGAYPRYGGAFFPRSQNFTVSRSTFTSITNNHTSTIAEPSDFRSIPLGDIDLRHEIRPSYDSGIVFRRSGRRASVRRMYSAKIDGRNANMTVALYEGYNAEQEWRADISRYSGLRHPNVLQIFAIASSSGVHAIVSHDDLIPFHEFLGFHSNSAILTACIYAHADAEFWEADRYHVQMFGSYIDRGNSTVWIRRSTGRLCVDLSPSDIGLPNFLPPGPVETPDRIVHLNDPNPETIFIDSLELEQYHYLCGRYLRLCQHFFFSTHVELHQRAVVCCPRGSKLDGSVKIAFLTEASPHFSSWHTIASTDDGDVMENGWTRFNSRQLFGATMWLYWSVYEEEWLSQANHIFHRLQITSNSEDYVIVNRIELRIEFAKSAQSGPEGYFFACPLDHLHTGALSFRWPDCPAYWSLDASGSERLSTDEATDLGFPPIKLEATVVGKSWGASVYTSLRKFHEAKGFDPDSQDVARHLGHPLYQLSHAMDLPFAHVDGEVFEDEMEAENNSPRTTKDEKIDEVTPQDAGPDSSFDALEISPSSRSWRIVMAVKFGLIIALTLLSLYEYAIGWLVSVGRSQR